MTNWTEVFNVLWNFVIQVTRFVSILWNWLTEPVTVGFGLDKVNIPIIGDAINWGINLINSFSVTFVPLYVFGGVTIITLLTLYLIKTFIPVA